MLLNVVAHGWLPASANAKGGRGERGPLRSTEGPATPSRALGSAYRSVRRGGRAARQRGVAASGGPARTRILLVLASVLALSSAATATVGAAALQLRSSLHIGNTDIRLLLAVDRPAGCE